MSVEGVPVSADGGNILELKDLRKRFGLEAGFFSSFGKFVYAVNGVSFAIKRNTAFGLVGESGCGKTTTARLAVRMYRPDGGDVVFNGTGGGIDVLALKGNALKEYRRKVRYVFQDPARSLNPRMSVYRILTDGWRWSKRWPGEKKAREAASAILEEVGLSPDDLERRPADFSGGQRQRISIARGLLMEPELLICDEIISALDVSIQGQILNLLLDVRKTRGLSFLFIAHDLRAACYFCDRIAVMYRGEIMEEAPAADLYRTAVHPYTEMLFAAAGRLSSDAPGGSTAHGGGGGQSEHTALSGGIPDGCVFADRCPRSCGKCFAEKPTLRALPHTGAMPEQNAPLASGRDAGRPFVPDGDSHLVRCHFTAPV